MTVISIRPPREMKEKIEELAKIKQVERSSLVRQLLDRAIKGELKDYALDLFAKRKVSLAKAAEIAGITIREMHELVKDRDIVLHISSEDIRKDYEAAVK
jgi:predicted HTH domain antitoxin